MSNVKYLLSLWWGKLTNLVSQTNLHSFLTRKRNICPLGEFRPHFISEFKMLPENGFSSRVLNGQSLCQSIKDSGRCVLRGNRAAMDLEQCACASFTFFGSQIGDCSNRENGTNIVKRQGNLERPEEVIQAYAISNEAT